MRVSQGPPYPPQNQALGGIASIIPDVPVSAVFLFLFAVGAALHMGTFQAGKKTRKFPICAATFGFCLTRIGATSLRITWATHPTSVPLAIAAAVFLYAGLVILLVNTLIMAQRIVRSQHPNFGWSRTASGVMIALIVIACCAVVTLISAILYSFFTLDVKALHRVRNIQIYANAVFVTTAFVPIPITLGSAIARRYSTTPTDAFGEGRIMAKILIVLVTSILLSLGTAYRAGILYLTPVQISEPPVWYFGKAPFYIFNFGIEAAVVYFWLGVRIDKRFFTPDGAKGPYSYAGKALSQ